MMMALQHSGGTVARKLTEEKNAHTHTRATIEFTLAVVANDGDAHVAHFIKWRLFAPRRVTWDNTREGGNELHPPNPAGALL